MDKKTDEFEKYMKELTETFENLKMDIDTGSSLINAIVIDLSSKFEDVDFKCSGHFNEKIYISSLDICTIFSNILKNAYEAAAKTEDKQIELSIGYVGTNLFIKLENSALRKPVMKNSRYISDKENEGHGYGLQNVIDCVERLGGEFRMSYADKAVVVEIAIFNALPIAHGDTEYRSNAKNDRSP